jgi:hypothetical protein
MDLLVFGPLMMAQTKMLKIALVIRTMGFLIMEQKLAKQVNLGTLLLLNPNKLWLFLLRKVWIVLQTK